MPVTHDVIVVGLGAMGSAALFHLARRKVRVLGIERFAPGHDRGSSHGRTRIIRQGYFEHPSYVPLVRHAYDLWRELERQCGRQLLTITGIAEIGKPDSTLVRGTLAAAREHHLVHEVWPARELMRRYPAFRIPDDFVGAVQPDGGFVEAEAGIRAHVQMAIAAGAQVRTNTQVIAIEPAGNHVRVRTDDGDFEAGRVIVTTGAWTTSLLPELALPLKVTRQVLLWVQPKEPDLFRAGRFPVFMIESEDGIHYGFPLHNEDGLKIAKHHHEREIVDPETYDRTVSPADRKLVLEPVTRYLPAAEGQLINEKTCLYTMAPDEDFVIDRMPGQDNIVIASPCSGHGFKFAPTIGEALADLALTGQTRFDLSRFRLARLIRPIASAAIP